MPEPNGTRTRSRVRGIVRDRLRENGFEVVPADGRGRVLHLISLSNIRLAAAMCWALSAMELVIIPARSARDRDRLRQQVLEQLHWNIYRIWSTDWFQNRRRGVSPFSRVAWED